MRPWYATRENVKRALEVKETARNDDQVDRAVAAASGTAEGALRRLFYPQVVTRTFPVPTGPDGRLLVLDGLGTELISVAEILNDGTVVDPADFDLLPKTGPPFTRIRFASTITFVGPSTNRRPISIEGVAGYDLNEPAAGELAAAVGDTTTTTVDLGAAPTIGVGSLIRVDTERMLVAGRAMLDTGQTLTNNPTASTGATTIGVADGTAFAAGEVLLVDAERMLVVDVAGNQLIVRRAWDGSVLASHSAGAAVFALRRLTVERGVLGTTAATHELGAPVLRHEYPPTVVAYTVALAEDVLLQEISGQTHESEGHSHQRVLTRLRDAALVAVGKKATIG